MNPVWAGTATTEQSKPIADRSAELSSPAFPEKPRAPEGAPNILLVLTDDVGFGAASSFGGLIPTPALDRLAATGYTLNNFNTTAMCSPTRAALLTGRNAHAAGMGALTDLATGHPGYYGEMPASTATIADVLGKNGYSTGFFGKHHGTPLSESSTAGPFENWPTGLGFDYFYGFIGGQTDQWNPALIRGVSRVEPKKGDLLDKMLVDDAIRWMQNSKSADPSRPFFLYLAPGTAHAPLQAPEDWIARFRGKFDQGWDKAREEIFERQLSSGVIPETAQLTPRPSFIPAWDTLSDKEKRVASRLMEVYAAQLSYQDAQFGRLLDELQRTGQIDNTLILFIEGDNGPSSEGGPHGTTNHDGHMVNGVPESIDWLYSNMDKFGGPDSHAHYPMGWAWAMSTPFQYFKRFASHLGGIRNGAVVAWPERLSGRGELRSSFHHVVDVAPTVYAAAGIALPREVEGAEQRPLDGLDMLPALRSGRQEAVRTQYFELLGNRSIYHDGWMASTIPPLSMMDTSVSEKTIVSPDEYDWALYNLDDDFSQSTDIADRHPGKLAELKQLWDAEARRNQVFPLDNSMTISRVDAEPTARLPIRSQYVYWGSGAEPERGSLPPILTRSFELTATVTDVEDSATGVMTAIGNAFGGWSFYLKDGYPTVYQAYSDQPQHKYVLRDRSARVSGDSRLGFSVTYSDEDRSASVAISVNGRITARGTFPYHINMVDVGEPMTFGRDGGDRVTDEYPHGGTFPGQVQKVQIDITDLQDRR